MFFLLASIFVFNTIAFFIPKRMTGVEIYGTILFATVFQLLVDLYLSTKHDLYGYFVRGVEYKELLIIFGIFPAANIIYLNYFPYKKKLISKIIYILAWSSLITLYEWASVKAEYFYYNGWKLVYSALSYPFILLVLAVNLWFIRKLKEKA